MSVDYFTYLVVGVRLSDLVTVERVEQKATRYHEVTGKPFEAMLLHDRVTFCGKAIDPPSEPHPEEWVPKLLPGLRVVSTGEPTFYGVREGLRKYKLDEFVVGKVLGEIHDDNGGIKVVDVDQIQGATLVVFNEIAKHGQVIQPNVFLVSSVSC